MTSKTIVFFQAGQVKTGGEATTLDSLNAMAEAPFVVKVVNNLTLAEFGNLPDGDPRPIPADYAIGVIPDAYADLPVFDAVAPWLFNIWPRTYPILVAGTKQLVATKVTGSQIYSLSETDVTVSSTTYASSDATKATVSNAGLITGVAAGTTTITATHTYATGKTITATCAVTVS